MRILYSHRTRSADGQYVHIAALRNALRAAGADVCVVGPDGVEPDGVEKPLSAGDGGAGLADRLPKAIYELAERAYSIPGTARLSKAAVGFDPDILYERYNLHYHAGASVARRRGVPLILEVNAPLRAERLAHGGLALPAMAEKAERRIWRAADAVITVTRVLADEICRAGVAPDRVHVLPNGVDALFLAEADGRAVRQRYGLANKIVLGFTGFVRDWHGVDMAVGTIANHPDIPLHLLLVGDGPHADELRAHAARRGVSDRLTITGVVQKPELPGYIAAFDIALQPAATAYASPLKLFEYMGLGRPVIAPDQPNINEILTNDHDAVLFAPGNEAAFSAGILALANGPELRRKIGIAARETIRMRDLTWAGNGRRTLEIAQSLLSRKGRDG